MNYARYLDSFLPVDLMIEKFQNSVEQITLKRNVTFRLLQCCEMNMEDKSMLHIGVFNASGDRLLLAKMRRCINSGTWFLMVEE